MEKFQPIRTLDLYTVLWLVLELSSYAYIQRIFHLLLTFIVFFVQCGCVQCCLQCHLRFPPYLTDFWSFVVVLLFWFCQQFICSPWVFSADWRILISMSFACSGCLITDNLNWFYLHVINKLLDILSWINYFLFNLIQNEVPMIAWMKSIRRKLTCFGRKSSQSVTAFLIAFNLSINATWQLL